MDEGEARPLVYHSVGTHRAAVVLGVVGEQRQGEDVDASVVFGGATGLDSANLEAVVPLSRRKQVLAEGVGVLRPWVWRHAEHVQPVAHVSMLDSDGLDEWFDIVLWHPVARAVWHAKHGLSMLGIVVDDVIPLLRLWGLSHRRGKRRGRANRAVVVAGVLGRRHVVQRNAGSANGLAINTAPGLDRLERSPTKATVV